MLEVEGGHSLTVPIIMDAAVMLDEARPENLKAMVDFTKEYGVYQ